ncbi:anthrone oxygenase family protein [Streptomyces sp. MI02-2A]|uniref:anthrone oxygenase family protein n=1 Tax=Streptomyces sp. MI02-2A TaxID=3028688 RepID=UPI0029C069E4|nr:anthrone oxygenase family protein [Streptomyces sp. MI02-2A]
MAGSPKVCHTGTPHTVRSSGEFASDEGVRDDRRRLCWYIGAVTVPTLVAVVMLVLHARRAHSAVLRPSVVALVLLLLALLVTLVVNGPVNVQESDWNALTPPADWARVRDRWQIAHAVRTVAIVLALDFLGVAVPDRPVPVSSGHGGAGT